MKKILDLSSWSVAIGSMLIMAFAFVGCDDSSSASAENSEPAALSSAEKQGSSSSSRHCEECNDDAISSSGNVESSSSEKLSETSSSSADEIESSSGESDVSQNSAEAKVMPSGTYDCTKYKCVTTEYLNQEFLETGKYGEILDERDGQVYKTVKIGGQVWMAQNLNYADSAKTPSLLGRSWCYEGEPKKCEVAGRLYTWAAVIDSVKLYDGGKGIDCGFGKTCTQPSIVQGICPPGWRLPDFTEWQKLVTNVDESLDGKWKGKGKDNAAGKMLKSQTGWQDDGNGTDDFGFSALPAGYRFYQGNFNDEGYYTGFWCSTENLTDYAYKINMQGDGKYVDVTDHNKGGGYSVRCLKD